MLQQGYWKYKAMCSRFNSLRSTRFIKNDQMFYGSQGATCLLKDKATPAESEKFLVQSITVSMEPSCGNLRVYSGISEADNRRSSLEVK